jgi:Xaa-Pro aminopeptidase
VLSQEFQLPLVNRVMDKMQRKRRLPKLPKKLVKPTIVTGLEALGRGHDLNKLDVFIQGAAQLLGPEFPTYVNMSDYLKRRATSIGIETAGLIKTAEEIEAEKQAQQQQAAMMQAAGPAINAAGKVTDTAVKEGMQQQQQQ